MAANSDGAPVAGVTDALASVLQMPRVFCGADSGDSVKLLCCSWACLADLRH